METIDRTKETGAKDIATALADAKSTRTVIGGKKRKAASFEEWLKSRSPRLRWDPPHIQVMIRELEALTLAQKEIYAKADAEACIEDGGRAMMLMPPRHGKTELGTVHYCAWRLEDDPTLPIILGAHTQELAEKFSRRIRRMLRGRVAMSDDKNAANDWETAAGGGIRAVGIGTGVVGRGAKLIVLDDLVKSREEAESKAFRERGWEWLTDDLYTRQEPGCMIVWAGTCYHEDDPMGRMLKCEEGQYWRVIRMPALAEMQEERDAWAERNKRPTGLPDPIGREPGQALWPWRFNEAKLERRRRLMGASFLAQFQQTPVAAGGTLFKREWFNIVDEAPPGLRWIRFWDCAAKASDRNDYTAGAWCAITKNKDLYIRNMVRGRWEYPEMKLTVMLTAKADGDRTMIGVEDCASGTVILQDLKREDALRGHIIKGVKVSADKVVRAGPWAALASVGKVYLVRGEWNHDFLDEAVVFPGGGHDDQIDAVSGAYELMMENPAFGPNPVTLPMMGRDYVRGAARRCLVPW